MTITEGFVNHIIVELIGELCIDQTIFDDKDDPLRRYNLGYIMGMRDLGERLREVLKA